MEHEKLFEPGKIGTMTVKNRVVMTGVGVMTADPGGYAGEREIAYWKERAAGGTGLLISAVTRINDKDSAVAPTQLSMGNDRFIPGMKKLVDTVHAEGSKFVVQLHHPGRQNFQAYWNMAPFIEGIGRAVPKAWPPILKMLGSSEPDALNHPPMTTMAKYFMKPDIAPSAVPLQYGDTPIKNQQVRALTKKEILKLEDQYAEATLRVKKSGADGVELHSAHGYLMAEFLSPHTNRRSDEYGGSLENRTRFLKETMAKIREKVGPDYPILVRFNVDEFYRDIGMPGVGLELDEGVKIAELIESFGADALDISCGTYETLNHLMEVSSYPMGWRTYLAAEVKKHVSIPVISVGMIRTPEQAEELLESGAMDFIGMARPLIADPEWTRKAKEGRSEDIVRCIACQTCKITQLNNTSKGETARCALNSRACHEYELPKTGVRNGNGRTVVVVGAGPAGLAASRELALRGFHTVLLGKEAFAGGQLNLAKQPPHREKFDWPGKDLLVAAKNAGVEVHFGVAATEEVVLSYTPYAVFICTGGSSARPKIPGAEQDHVSTVTPVLDGSLSFTDEDVVLVGSGLTGLETAELLLSQGNRVTILEMAKEAAPGTWIQETRDILPRLDKLGAKIYANRRLTNIAEDYVEAESEEGSVYRYPASRVVLSLGVRPNQELYSALQGKVENLILLGDAKKSGKIIDATLPAFEAARALG